MSALYLKVDIKNIGVAPFYYNHELWPVEIGIKKGDSVVKTWRTTWVVRYCSRWKGLFF